MEDVGSGKRHCGSLNVGALRAAAYLDDRRIAGSAAKRRKRHRTSLLRLIGESRKLPPHRFPLTPWLSREARIQSLRIAKSNRGAIQFHERMDFEGSENLGQVASEEALQVRGTHVTRSDQEQFRGSTCEEMREVEVGVLGHDDRIRCVRKIRNCMIGCPVALR